MSNNVSGTWYHAGWYLTNVRPCRRTPYDSIYRGSVFSVCTVAFCGGEPESDMRMPVDERPPAGSAPGQNPVAARPAISISMARPVPSATTVARALPPVQITTVTGAAYVPPPPRPTRTTAELEAEQAQLAAKGACPSLLTAGLRRALSALSCGVGAAASDNSGCTDVSIAFSCTRHAQAPDSCPRWSCSWRPAARARS